jgi:hypothetical protein
MALFWVAGKMSALVHGHCDVQSCGLLQDFSLSHHQTIVKIVCNFFLISLTLQYLSAFAGVGLGFV